MQATDSHGNSSASPTRALTLSSRGGGGSASGGGGQPPPAGGPSASIDQPTVGSTYSPGDFIDVQATATDPDASVASVQLVWHSPSGDTLFDLGPVGQDVLGISLRLYDQAVVGPRTLRVSVTDENGQSTTSSPVVVQVQ